ncbi:hypothetical protein [Sphaerisporangium corydalis]|uniref:Uncharacterized protein n=1 Tax=Sphaerisporangium corydalis TaxID=1441875 RepID=A0ABV9E819_9ACTN|nr:hypothetical protein [Sphaerisporangium corydalis]
MIRRLFYMALGAYIALWVSRRLQALKPDHVARRVAGRASYAAAEARVFATEVRRLAAGREHELRALYGLDSVREIHHDVKDGR